MRRPRVPVVAAGIGFLSSPFHSNQPVTGRTQRTTCGSGTDRWDETPPEHLPGNGSEVTGRNALGQVENGSEIGMGNICRVERVFCEPTEASSTSEWFPYEPPSLELFSCAPEMGDAPIPPSNAGIPSAMNVKCKSGGMPWDDARNGVSSLFSRASASSGPSASCARGTKNSP